MADVSADMDSEHAALPGRRYLIRFEETRHPSPEGEAPVTQTSTSAPIGGDTMILPGPAPAVS
jgi:hypothetical protein